MTGFFSGLKDKVSSKFSTAPPEDDIEQNGEDYVELAGEVPVSESKIVVRPFTLEDFDSIKPILDALREGLTVALINISPSKEKDLVELKRAISKLKKTADAINGDIAGFGDDWLVAVPNFAKIYRTKDTVAVKDDQ